MIDSLAPFELPPTGREPDPMSITMLRMYVGSLERFQELLAMLPDSFFHLPSSQQAYGFERMLLHARSTVGTINLTDLAEIGAEVCR